VRGELLGEATVRHVRLRDDQQPARVLVETVHDPGPPHAANAGKALPAVGNERVDQCPARVARRRVHDHAGGLVDNDEVAILMGDGEARIFRLRRRRLGRWHGNDIALARFDPQAGLFYRPARAPHAALLDESLQARA
jgi:hypothetical protein